MMQYLKRVVVAGCLMMAVTVQAVLVKDLFIRMPGEILQTLNQSARRDLVDFYENQQKAAVPSVFDFNVALSTLTDDYLLLQTSSLSTIQAKLLPLADSTVVMVINTVMGPLPDSRARFYSKNWKPITGIQMPVLLPRHFLDTTRLDAEQVDRFDRICSHFFIRMDANPESSVIHVRGYFGEEVPQELLAPYKGLYTDSLTLTWNGKGYQFH